MGVLIDEAFEKFGPELLRHASMLVGPSNAEDVVSEAVIGALRSPKWLGIEDQEAYLHRSVMNAAKMMMRSRSRSTRREWKAASLVVDSDSGLLLRPEVLAAVRRLSVQQRSVVYFTYWADHSPEQIAVTLDISKGSVKRHLARARANLRKVLDD